MRLITDARDEDVLNHYCEQELHARVSQGPERPSFLFEYDDRDNLHMKILRAQDNS
jgi:hypothetical protein